MTRHLPLLRMGRPYRSLDVTRVVHHRTGAVHVEVSQANVGLIRRDLLQQGRMRAALAAFSTRDLVTRSAEAARQFLEGTLPLGDGTQSPEEYVADTSATTGLPFALVRRSMARIAGVLSGMGDVLAGLTRGVPLELLDAGIGESDGRPLGFVPRADALGVVLPSNSPGVHALWVPAVALKTGLVLKPGSAEPWTPYRLIQAFLAAGLPPEAFSYYPTSHGGGAEILRGCGRGMVFGDAGTTSGFLADPRIEVHGPGYSKVVLGPDEAPSFSRHLDVMVASILDNSGRSCVNASGIWTTSHGREIAEALAARLAPVVPRTAEDPAAQLAPLVDPRVAERISALIDEGLRTPGAEDVTARHRGSPRLVRFEGATYLLPTIVRCDSPDHPLANREFLFPFASVVEVEAEEMPACLGPTLAATVLTADEGLRRRLAHSPLVHRLNLGPQPTSHVRFDQPHEGNLFEHLYARRAVQMVDGGLDYSSTPHPTLPTSGEGVAPGRPAGSLIDPPPHPPHAGRGSR